jgi:catechol 2,3-dioxygenase-like lactoylglutathione lyase family enzyme
MEAIMKSHWISILALTCFCASPTVHAQTPAITGIAHIAYRVSDLDKEVKFFAQLGYEVAFANTSGAKTTEAFVKIDDRQFIEIYPQTDPSQPLGWMHVCYETDAPYALDSIYAEHGLNPTKVVKAGAGNLLFTLKDPEGRVTEFTQYMPGSRHTHDRGLHLGQDRVSGHLLGFELPVADLAAARKFYLNLGFDVKDAAGAIRLAVPGAPDLRIEVHSAGAGSEPQTLFAVPDARKAADKLRRMGLNGKRHGKLVFVRDPDGNSFVLMETGSEL